MDVVSDGVQAVRAVRANAYDLVFMDCHMPGMDGFEATRVLRTDGCRVPIIAFTADAVADNRERCTAAGMDDCITKPVSVAGRRAAPLEPPERRASRVTGTGARASRRLWYTGLS